MKIKSNSKPFTFSLGDRGEIIAAAYLTQKGFTVLDKKIRAPFGEIDLIVRSKTAIIFVEVKTRSTKQFGLPAEAVDLAKQKQMVRLAEWYLQKNGFSKMRARFDVMAILYDGQAEPQIQHIENAFEVPE